MDLLLSLGANLSASYSVIFGLAIFTDKITWRLKPLFKALYFETKAFSGRYRPYQLFNTEYRHHTP